MSTSTATLSEKIEETRLKVSAALETVGDLRELEELRVKYLGKKGEIKSLQKGLGGLSAEKRPKVGAEVNRLHDQAETQLESIRERLEAQELSKRLKEESIDITLPGRNNKTGAAHPVRIIIEEVTGVFLRMGYDIHIDREIENDYYNFEALNFPPDHPARDMQDTYFLPGGLLLRSQTSNGQIHYMEQHKPPIKVVVPGRVYRRDSDPTHLPMFHQIEGLVVAKGISMANLKWTLETFLKQIFGPETRSRFRPSYFPFTEPSAEVDLWFETAPGQGKWMEILGAGLVDPNVLLACQIDPEVWSGFAFGMGVERLAMVRYGIPDIRTLYENDVRVLTQFRGARRASLV